MDHDKLKECETNFYREIRDFYGSTGIKHTSG